MTKGEIRKARQAARAAGQPLTGELALPGVEGDAMVRIRTRREEARHARRMDRWVRRYEALNGAPESDDDR